MGDRDVRQNPFFPASYARTILAMSYDTILVQTRDRVGLITLNRPPLGSRLES